MNFFKANMKNTLACLLFFAAGFLNAESIKISAFNPSRRPGTHVLYAGVPLKCGSYRNTEQFGVFSNGRRLPAQFAVLSRWQDGSLRWVSADIQAVFDGSEYQDLILKTDAAGKNETGSVTVKESADHFEINTGKTVFRVGRKDFFFAPAGEKSMKLSFRDADGKLFSAADGQLESAQLTVKGSIRTAIRLEGWFGSGGKEQFCRYILHLDFTSGSPVVKAGFTFVITGEKDRARFNEISMSIPAPGNTGTIGGIKGNAVGRYLLQYAYDKYLAGRISDPSVYRDKGDGVAAPGWAASGKTALFMEDFRENFPSELALDGNSIICYLWPAHGVAKPDRKITDANRQYLWFCHENKVLDFNAPAEYLQASGSGKHYIAEAQKESCLGVAKTMHCRIDYGYTGVISGFLTHAPVALPDKKTVASSGVFGPMQFYDPERYPVEEAMIERRSALEKHLSENTGPGDFGKWNYGDGHSIWRVKNNRWDDSWRTWKGYHHASGSVPWIIALRKTGFAEMKRAIAVSRHLTDIDICHYDTPESRARSAKQYAVNGKIKGGLNDYKGLTHWHAGDRLFDYNAQTEFALTYWYITGNLRGYEVAKMWGDAVVNNFKRTWDRREGTGTSAALVDLYLATGDKRYLDVAAKFIAHVLRTQTPAGVLPAGKLQKGALTGWANYAPGLRKYYEVTKSPAVREAICRWADAFMNGYGDTTSTGAKLHDCIDVMAYAWMFTGKIKYLEYGRWLLDNYIYLYNSNDPAKCKPFESVEYFMTERIPVFLAAQSAYGKPLKVQPLTKGLPEFTFKSHGKPKNGDFTVYFKGDGKPFVIDAGFITSNQHAATFSFESSKGKVLCTGNIKPDKEKQGNIRITADPAPAGVYVLKLRKNLASLRVVSRLPQVSPAGSFYSSSGGGSFAFEVTEPGLLEWKCRPHQTPYPVFAALISPEGKMDMWRFYFPRDGKEKRFRKKVTPGIWVLSGIFAPMPSNLKLNRKPISWFSPSAEKYFAPGKVSNDNSAGAVAKYVKL